MTKPRTLDKPKIIEFYKTGLSTWDIGQIFGCDKATIAKVCREAGIIRNGVIAPVIRRQSFRSNKPRRLHYQARKIMERHLGRRLLREEDVHHKDRDIGNNDIDNLEVLFYLDHQWLHRPPKRNPKPKHLNHKVQVYQKEYQKEYNKRERERKAKEQQIFLDTTSEFIPRRYL